jgi:hypothetical protein
MLEILQNWISLGILAHSFDIARRPTTQQHGRVPIRRCFLQHNKLCLPIYFGDRDNLAGIASTYGLGGSGFKTRHGWGRFCAPVQTGPGAYPASYTMRTGSLSRE